MGVGEIIAKLMNSKDPRDLYEVPLDLCSGVSVDELAEKALAQNLHSQLGVITDITLTYLIDEQCSVYSSLQRLTQLLHPQESPEKPFYCDDHPKINEIIKSRLHKMNSPEMCTILKKWGIICVLSPEKFKEVFDRNYEGNKTSTD